MNAAFLLMASALVAGQPAAEKKAPPPAAAPAAVASSCGHDCDCDRFGHRFRERWRGLFNRDCCDTCQPAKCPTTCHAKCEREPLFHSRCKDACRPKLWNWEPRCHEPKCHAPKACAPTCAPACNNTCCEREGFLAKLRARFQRDRCCDTCCSAPGKAPEKIDTAPKKMPDVKDKGKGKGTGTSEEVRFDTPPAPFTPNVIRVAPTAPTVEVVPTPAPRVGGDRRDPF